MKNAFLLVVAAVVVFAASCGDEPTNTTPPNTNTGKLSVTSIMPATAGSGDTLTISGRNFGVNTADITVLLDSLVFNPIFMNDSSIRIIIPTTLAEKTYAITVRKKSESSIGGNIVIDNIMVVFSIMPVKAWRGDTVTITGKRFGNTAADITVQFDALSAKPFLVSDTIIKVIVPQAVTGNIIGGGKVQSISSGINKSASKSYSIVISKGGKSVTAAQQIVMEAGKFQFLGAIIDLRMGGTTYSYNETKTQPVGMPQYTQTTTRRDTIPGIFKTIYKAEQCIGYNAPSCYNNYSPPKISICCSTLDPYKRNGITSSVTGIPDTINQIIPQINVTLTSEANSGDNTGKHSSSKSELFSISLTNVSYTETAQGIEIYYIGTMISDLNMLLKLQVSGNSSDLYSGLWTWITSNSSFILSSVYAPDDYIKITLYR